MAIEWLNTDSDPDDLPWMSEWSETASDPKSPLLVIKIYNYRKGALLITEHCKAMLWRKDTHFATLFKYVDKSMKEDITVPVYIKHINGKRFLIGADHTKPLEEQWWVLEEADVYCLTNEKPHGLEAQLPDLNPLTPTRKPTVGKSKPAAR